MCDACGATMADPYQAKMREFYVGMTYDMGFVVPINIKTSKTTIDLCDDCFHALNLLAKEKGG